MGQAAYSASKAGIVGLTLPVARDLSVAVSGSTPSCPAFSTRRCCSARRSTSRPGWRRRCRSRNALAIQMICCPGLKR